MHVDFHEKIDWPPLAWLANCPIKSEKVLVFHGRNIEKNDGWFCEAVWDGEFSEGRFDQTDIIFGSGARICGDKVVFVSSGSTTDRLHSYTDKNVTLVSNSLPCLLAVADAKLDPTYCSYYSDACSIVEGLDSYKRKLTTTAGNIDLHYFQNLVWDGLVLSESEKPDRERDFSCFDAYKEFLESTFMTLYENMSHQSRKYPYKMLGTLSSGYDSTAVSVLANSTGCKEAITFSQARDGKADSGHTAAAVLGIKLHEIDREAWRDSQFPEVPFLASYSSAEDINLSGAETLLEGKVLMTGYHGDKVWDKNASNLSSQLVRGDPSGLSLCEYRLWVGFINCPVPFWGAKQICEINAISNSGVMGEWDVSGDYSRPICRRIAEEAGIPRESFGQQKHAISMNPNAGRDLRVYKEQFLTPSSLESYLVWIKDRRMEWLRRFRVPPIASAVVNDRINRGHMLMVDFNNWLATQPLIWRYVKYRHYQPKYLNKYLFPWAIEQAKRKYEDRD